MPIWIERVNELARLADRTVFFIGGAPRSGTTWLQQLLDAHPDVSCRGEGLFLKHLAQPLDVMMAQRGQALEAKNFGLFRHTGGYPLPAADDVEFLLGTAILLALQQQCGDSRCLAIGEKTPENVFFFPRLKNLFPGAKLVVVARDPRDVLTSAWHFFRRPVPGEDESATKIAFIRSALPSLDEGARATLALSERHPAEVLVVTYEALRADTELVLSQLFRFLGVSDAPAIVAACVAQTAFAAATGGRPAGVAQDGSFFRQGMVGDWPSTLTPEMNEMVLQKLGWAFPRFGWHP